MDNLKRCSFCGSIKARIVRTALKYEREDFGRIKCDNCGAYGPIMIIRVGSDAWRHEATKAWNTRPGEDAAVAAERHRWLVPLYDWWLTKRPTEYSDKDHIDNPEVNCVNGSEKLLAKLCAEAVRARGRV